jgi:oxaloacetate decarboxylase gamma subunit
LKPSRRSPLSSNPAESNSQLVERLRGEAMDTWTFGWTLALIGMGGTMLVLWLLSLLILLIKKIFPYQRPEADLKKG